MKWLKNYDFKRGWYRILIFFLFDTFVLMFCIGLVYALDNPDILPTELLKIGKYEVSYYDWILFMSTFITFNLLLTLVKTIWSMLFDWSINCKKKGNIDNE